MFAAVRASRAIKRSSGRRKGRGKLLECSAFYGPLWVRSQRGYYAAASNPQFQTSRSKDDTYTQIVPWNSDSRSAANTYFFQFRLQGLPLVCPAGSSMVVPQGMLKFHSTGGAYANGWHDVKTGGFVQKNTYRKRSLRFWKTVTDYGYFRWVLVCVAGSTIQDAKYRLAPEFYHSAGHSSYSGRVIPAALQRFRSHLRTSSDAPCIAIMGNYSNRGYAGPFWQGQNTWGGGSWSGTWGGYQSFTFYGYQLDLTFMGAPGKFIEWRRQ